MGVLDEAILSAKSAPQDLLGAQGRQHGTDVVGSENLRGNPQGVLPLDVAFQPVQQARAMGDEQIARALEVERVVGLENFIDRFPKAHRTLRPPAVRFALELLANAARADSGGTTGQRTLFENHDVGNARPRQVPSNRATDYPAPDDDDVRSAFAHGLMP